VVGGWCGSLSGRAELRQPAGKKCVGATTGATTDKNHPPRNCQRIKLSLGFGEGSFETCLSAAADHKGMIEQHQTLADGLYLGRALSTF
jgi:hypothetical protein